MGKRDKVLYCIASERRGIDGWFPRPFEYVKADEIPQARAEFWRGIPANRHNDVRIIGVAPVVGYFVEDSHGEKLSV